MPVSSTGKQTAYVREETTFGTGVTPVGADALQFTSLSTDAIQGTVDRTDKTGSADAAISILDNGAASFQMGYEMSGSGTAGTVADDHVLMTNLFGATTVSAGTSVTYTPDDVEKSFTLFNCDKPTANDQEVIIGGIVESGVFRIGGAIPFIELSGSAKWCIRKNQWDALNTEQRGGFSAFPAEPSSPAIVGFPPRGRTGSITIDGRRTRTSRTRQSTLAPALPSVRRFSAPVRRLALDAFAASLRPTSTSRTMAVRIGRRSASRSLSIRRSQSPWLSARSPGTFTPSPSTTRYCLSQFLTALVPRVSCVSPESRWLRPRQPQRIRSCTFAPKPCSVSSQPTQFRRRQKRRTGSAIPSIVQQQSSAQTSNWSTLKLSTSSRRSGANSHDFRSRWSRLKSTLKAKATNTTRTRTTRRSNPTREPSSMCSSSA